MPRKISNAELQNKMNTLPLSEILKMLKVYSNTNGVDISANLNKDKNHFKLSTFC